MTDSAQERASEREPLIAVTIGNACLLISPAVLATCVHVCVCVQPTADWWMRILQLYVYINICMNIPYVYMVRWAVVSGGV